MFSALLAVRVSLGSLQLSAVQRQLVPTGSRVTDGNCGYYRHPGIGVRHDPESVFGPPTSLGFISGLNESACANHCWSRQFCTTAVFDTGGVFRPKSNGAMCYLLATPLQFFIQFESELPKGVARMVTMNDINCNTTPVGEETHKQTIGTKPTKKELTYGRAVTERRSCTYTSFRLKDLTAESFELRTADVLSASGLDDCASFCARQPADCILVVFEAVGRHCYLIVDSDAANAIVGHYERVKRPDRQRTFSHKDRFYHVAQEISCPPDGDACPTHLPDPHY